MSLVQPACPGLWCSLRGGCLRWAPDMRADMVILRFDSPPYDPGTDSCTQFIGPTAPPLPTDAASPAPTEQPLDLFRQRQ